MTGYRKFILSHYNSDKLNSVNLKQIVKENKEYKVYPKSIKIYKGSLLFIAKNQSDKKVFVIAGESALSNDFTGVNEVLKDIPLKVCQMNVNNATALSEIFPWMKPKSHKGRNITVGLGDRLGLASKGHIKLIENFDVFPVIAQQSMRELKLTGRDYRKVLADAAWAVFEEGYKKGYGADGDHLKTEKEVKTALQCGYTMITLDCSEQINNDVSNMSLGQIDKLYLKTNKKYKEYIEQKYKGKKFNAANLNISFNFKDLKKIVLIYKKAIEHAINIYEKLICGKNIDFEISIDETLTPTTPEAHYFVARELTDRKMEIRSLAPRFCGEFQKGIDYIGDITQFKSEFEKHVDIAKEFGYKLSIHSGSDKFSVFPIIGELTGMKFHLKTAGTNWLEAVRVIAVKNPELYRRMHKYALFNIKKAKKYYHISADINAIPDIDKLSDDELPGLLNKDNSRQLMHITYGLLLTAKTKANRALFRDEIYDTLNKYENTYCQLLIKHIGRHFKTLGIC